MQLHASSINKPIITASAAIPLLVDILQHRGPQTKLDAMMALYNLSTHPDNPTLILQAQPVPLLVNLLKSCKKFSRTVEKRMALIEPLSGIDECRAVLTSQEGGILTSGVVRE